MKRKIFNIIIVTVISVTQTQKGFAQQGVAISSSATGINVAGYVSPGSDDSPYLYDDWSRGTVKLENGKSYSNLSLLYDIIRDRVIFKTDQGNIQAFVEPVKEFTLTGNGNNNQSQLFRSGYPSANGNSVHSYYEVLADGKTQYLKRLNKTIVNETIPGNIYATKQLKITANNYLFMASNLAKIKHDKKSIIITLGNKTQELENYINNNKLNFKNDDDIVRLINYYNYVN